MVEYLKTISIILISVYILSALLLYVRQDSLVFAGAYMLKNKIKESEHISDNTAVTNIIATDNTTLYGSSSIYDKDTLIIYFGGNAENVTNFVNMMTDIKDVDTVSLNYRGFGRSEGIPTQDNIYSDALEIYDHFKNKYSHIIIIGRSLGTAVATYTASKREVKGVILITPFDSIAKVAQDLYPLFPVSVLLKYPFNSEENIKTVTTPVSVLMVEDDEVISNKHTINLNKRISNLNIFTIIKNSGHNDIMEDKRLIDFIEESLKTI